MDWQEAIKIATEWKQRMPRVDVDAAQDRDGEWAVRVRMREGFSIYCHTLRAARRIYARWWRVANALADAGGHEQRPLGI